MPIITSQGVVGISRAAYLEEINTRGKRALGMISMLIQRPLRGSFSG